MNFKKPASRAGRRSRNNRSYGNSISKAIQYGWAKWSKRCKKFHQSATRRNRIAEDEI